MKVLLDCPVPFSLAHGGVQVQVTQTYQALQEIGVEVEYLRWWDEGQKGDLVHLFGVTHPGYVDLVQKNGLKIAMTPLFTATCNRSDGHLALQGAVTQMLLRLPGWGLIKSQLNWQAFSKCDAQIVGLEAEAAVLDRVYRVPRAKIHVVPLGLSGEFVQAGPAARSAEYLICTGTITDRKRSLDLASLAHAAQVPILFVGKPYDSAEPYWRKFAALIDGRWVRHHAHVSDSGEMIALLQTARGFVLYTRYENWCLSAHEAAAVGLPVLLTGQKWSRERFGDEATYLVDDNFADNVEILRKFYETAPSLPKPRVTIPTWRDIAPQLKSIYETLLSTSR